MEPISELTYQILAYSDLEEVDSNHAVDWALEMIDLGYESPHLVMLASFTKPVTYVEVIDYLKRVVIELGFEMKKGKEAFISYVTFYFLQISREQHVRRNLEILYRLYQLTEEENVIAPFYLLHWAWSDLDELGQTHYWEGATSGNISGIVVAEAREWLLINKPDICRNIPE